MTVCRLRLLTVLVSKHSASRRLAEQVVTVGRRAERAILFDNAGELLIKRVGVLAGRDPM